MRQINNFIDAFEAKCEEKCIKVTEARNLADVSRSSYLKYWSNYLKSSTYELPRDKAIALQEVNQMTLRGKSKTIHT